MELARLQDWGIFVSLVAVLVSVIGLSFQVRMNTRSLRSYSYSRALDRLAAVQSKLGADAALTELFFRGVRDPRSLTTVDRIRWRSKPVPFNAAFTAHVEGHIANPAHDAAASRRWQQFLEGRPGSSA